MERKQISRCGWDQRWAWQVQGVSSPALWVMWAWRGRAPAPAATVECSVWPVSMRALHTTYRAPFCRDNASLRPEESVPWTQSHRRLSADTYRGQADRFGSARLTLPRYRVTTDGSFYSVTPGSRKLPKIKNLPKSSVCPEIWCAGSRDQTAQKTSSATFPSSSGFENGRLKL